MKFSPRPCQQPMIDMMSNTPRCNIFASPGTGKTSATLVALDSLSAIGEDVWPVLVVAPLRVANVVWSDEVSNWARFKGITVSKILGNANEREAGLKARAQVYLINYQNLMWLHEKVGKWPFKTVIADESTAIKNHRVHFQKRNGKWSLHVTGKAKNARSLVRHAVETDRWVNLTGTPTPNGVENLWGQCWPIDFGQALGRTHSTFMERWFRLAFGSDKERPKYEPMPGSEAEILERIKPYSVAIDAVDWFDIEKPIEIDVKVPLPENARHLYNRMHRESVAEIKEHGAKAIAANKGGALMKCRQIASGHLRDTTDRWHTVHGAKLEALKEIVDKVDSPLLVAYHFKEDAKAIMRAFPRSILLPNDSTQKAVQDKWNDGGIPMLLVHAQSAGHGLNLAKGGNHLCLYTPDWNAEYYEQIIERLGPTRQAQLGYKRPVYIHRLAAQNTWDSIILRRLKDKISVTEMVKQALEYQE